MIPQVLSGDKVEKMLVYVMCGSFWEKILMTLSLVDLVLGMVFQYPIIK